MLLFVCLFVLCDCFVMVTDLCARVFSLNVWWFVSQWWFVSETSSRTRSIFFKCYSQCDCLCLMVCLCVMLCLWRLSACDGLSLCDTLSLMVVYVMVCICVVHCLRRLSVCDSLSLFDGLCLMVCLCMSDDCEWWFVCTLWCTHIWVIVWWFLCLCDLNCVRACLEMCLRLMVCPCVMICLWWLSVCDGLYPCDLLRVSL